MSKVVRVVLHADGFRDVLASNGVGGVVNTYTNIIYDRIDPEYRNAFAKDVTYWTKVPKKMKHPEHQHRWLGLIIGKGSRANGRHTYGDYLQARYKVLTRAVRR